LKKKLLIFAFLLATGATIIYFYMYKEHRNIATETADYTITVPDLQKEFLINDNVAYQKYQDKTIQIIGTISSTDDTNKTIIVDDKLLATFLDKLSEDLVVGKQITIKGRFLGYDDLVEEFKIDQATVVE
jgi:hypothetical protein